MNITIMSYHLSLQVTIEVVDGLEGHEPERELHKESKPNWASPNWRNWWPHTSSSSSHQTEEHDRSYGRKTEDSNFLRPPSDWDRRGSKAQTEYGETDGRVWVFVSVCIIRHRLQWGSYLSTASQMATV